MAVDPERSRGMRGNKNAAGPRSGATTTKRTIARKTTASGAKLKLDLPKPSNNFKPSLEKPKMAVPTFTKSRAIASKMGANAATATKVESAARMASSKINKAKSAISNSKPVKFAKANIATKGGNTKTKLDDKAYAMADKVAGKVSKAKSFVKANMASKGKNTKTDLDDKVYAFADKAKKKVKSWMA